LRGKTRSDLCDLTEKELDFWSKKVNSLQSSLAMETHPNMGNISKYKQSFISNINFNISGKTGIFTRSSYETNCVKFFEKQKIKWDYESIRITCDNGLTYIPDFYFEYNDKKYLMEVKGYLYGDAGITYLKNKVNAGIRYAKNRNWIFLFTYESKPDKKFNFLKQFIIIEEF
jgi:predicted nuclease of restriction endonuclease-like RecB superfamily